MPNSKYWIEWNGISSDTMGDIIVTKAGIHSRPKRKVDVYNVPGRNGDIVIPQNSWENFNITYEIFVGNGAENNTPAKFHEIAEWLYKPTGYVKLRDGSDPDYFLMAYFVGPYDVENTLTQYGRCEISFICRPERYLIDGDWPETYTNSPVTLTNPTSFASKPLFRVRAGSDEPTMLRLTGRTEWDVPTKGVYDFSKSYIIFGDRSEIESYNIEEDTISFTNTYAGTYSIGMNFEIEPNVLYYIGMTTTPALYYSGNIIFFDINGTQIGATFYDGLDDWSPTRNAFLAPPNAYHAVLWFNNITETTPLGVTVSNIQIQPSTLTSSGRIVTHPYRRWDNVKHGSMLINDTIITLSPIDDYLYIDCETMNVYREYTQNRNNVAELSGGEFPVFTAGENFISWLGDIVSVDIKPRWWTL